MKCVIAEARNLTKGWLEKEYVMNTKVKTHIKSNKFVAAAGMAMLSWAAGSPAAPAYGGDALSVHVSYGDLNLDTGLGAKALYARIRNAAKEVCEPFAGRDLARRSKFDGCVSKAITSSVAAVNNARLTAMHNESVKLYGKS